MMDFGRFRYKADNDIIVVMDDPVVHTPEKQQDKNNQELLKKFENNIEKTLKKPEKKPYIKKIDENYHNEELMSKYLKGKGHFRKSYIDDDDEVITIKKEINLLDKYALNKEVTKVSNINLKNDDIKEEKPKFEKIINEDYENKTLMSKYLKGKGVYNKADYSVENEDIIIEIKEDLLEKYYLDKEEIINIDAKEDIEYSFKEEPQEININLNNESNEEEVELTNDSNEENISSHESYSKVDEELEKDLDETIEDILTNADNILVEEKPKFEKVINENYENTELMDKYLYGKGRFVKTVFEEEKKDYIIKKNEDLLVKYALDKIAIKPEVLKEEDGYVQLDSVDIPEDKEPLLEEFNDEEKEDMTPIELTDDIDAPILPEPASLNEIVENNIKKVQPEVQEEVEISEVFNEPSQTKVKVKKLSPIRSIIIVIAFIFLSFTGALYVYNSTNKVIVNKALSHIKGYSKYIANNLSFDETGELSLLGDIIFISNDIEEDINDAKIKYDFKKTERKRTLDLGLYKNERLNLATKINLSNNKGYVLFEDLYDKYIQLSNYSYSNEHLKDGELEDLTTYFITSFVKNINKENYKSENSKIIIDGKNVSVKKTNLTLNDKQLVEIYNKTIDNIIASSYYSSILKKIVKEDIKLDVNDLDSKNIKTYEISFYSSKILGKIKGIDFKVNYNVKKQICEFSIENLIQNKTEKCEKTKIEEQEFSVQYRLSDNNKFTINDADNNTIHGEIIEKDEEIVINLGDKDYVNIGHVRIYKLDDENIINFSLNQDNDKLDLTLKYQIDEVKINSEYNITISLDIETMDYTREKKTLSINTILTMKNKVDKNQDFVSEYVSSEDLTTNEIKSIRKKIKEKVQNIFGRLEEE